MKDVRQRYSQEINDILYAFQNIENGRYYEKTQARGDGYLANNAIKLRNQFLELLDLIENDSPSLHETLADQIFLKTEK